MGGDRLQQLQRLVVALRGELFLRRVDQPRPHLLGQALGIGMIGFQDQQPVDKRRQVEQPLFADRLTQIFHERGDFPPPGSRPSQATR